MLAPAAMFIESAADRLAELSPFIKQSQIKELHSFGDARAQAIGATGVTEDFIKGYELGLQTARTIIAGSPAIMLKGVKPGDVL